MNSWVSKFITLALGVLFCSLVASHSYAHHTEHAFMGGADIEIGTVVKKRVKIDTSAAEGAFRAIRIYNFGDRIDITKIVVKYADGTEHVENRSLFLKQGERTREIDPRLSDKFIDEVIVTYRRRPFSKRIAQIQVRGRQSLRGLAMARTGTKKPRDVEPVAKAEPEPKPAPEPEKPAETEYKPPENKVLVGTSPAPSKGRCGGPRSMLIATGRVDFGEDRDVIKVERPQMGKFDKLRLCVKRTDIELLDLKVNFEDGESIKLPFAGIIRSGERTDAMDLAGKHFVTNIDISYQRRRNFSRRAQVEIWGELSSNWLDGEAEQFNQAWVQLTSGDTAGFIGFEIDRSEVPTHNRGFKEVRVVTRNRDITLDYIRLSFADGTTQKFEANRSKVEPSAPYGPLKIEGGPKVITEVEARYRSRFFDREAASQQRATVEIHGHR